MPMSYVLMKILESAPYRYDKGIRILTLGKIDKAYDRLTERIKKNDKVLDIGCGTGMLTIRAAMKGATVTGNLSMSLDKDSSPDLTPKKEDEKT